MYFCELIENDTNTKSLFKIVDKINKKSPLPQHNNPKELAADFGKFFETIIDNMREHFIDSDECLVSDIPFPGSALENFSSLNLLLYLNCVRRQFIYK